MLFISALVDAVSAFDDLPSGVLSRAGPLAALVRGGATDGADLLLGTGAAERLAGGQGDDTILGLDGGDTLLGGLEGIGPLLGPPEPQPPGRDADLLAGGPGDDVLRGGADDDTLLGGAGRDDLDGGSGHDSLFGGDGDDVLTASTPYSVGFFRIYPETDGDLLAGGPGNDTLTGGARRDSLWGGTGADALAGMDGDDVLLGGSGDDTIHGGPGRNQMFGDAGADTFRFGYSASTRFLGLVGLGEDAVIDFEQGRDRLDVSALYRFQNQDADRIFLGQAPFSGSGQPELRFRHESGWTVLELDTPAFPGGPGSGGDGKVDFTIRLYGEILLTAGDFVF